MVGRGNRGMTPHSRMVFSIRQPIQRPSRRSTAADVGTAAHNLCIPGNSRAEMCAWMPGLRAKQAPGQRLIRAAPGEDRRCSGKKEAFRRSTGSAGGHREGEKPHYCTQQCWLGRHLARKQPVKDGGVCRVIGPSPGEADGENSLFRAITSEYSRISSRPYRKESLFGTPLCLISAISASDYWYIGRVAISGTQSDVCVTRTPQTEQTVGLKGDTP